MKEKGPPLGGPFFSMRDVLLTAALLTACTTHQGQVPMHATSTASADAQVLPITDARQTVLAMALAQMENGRRLTLVVPASATAEVRSAAAALHNVVSESEDLPAGYARLDALEVNGDKATVRLWTGPIPKPQPGVISMNCGLGHTFNLTRDTNGVWRITSQGLTVC